MAIHRPGTGSMSGVLDIGDHPPAARPPPHLVSLISRLLGGLLGQPQRRELADGLLFPAQAVLTGCDGENRPLALKVSVRAERPAQCE